MNTILINSGNSKTSDLHGLLLNLLEKINLKRSDKYVTLSNLCIYYKWKNIKMSYKNNEFKASSPTWNEEFELLDDSYSVSDFQDYFENITQKHEIVTNNPPIRIYVNKIKNRITFRIKIRYYLEPLVPETMNYLEALKVRQLKTKMLKMCLI